MNNDKLAEALRELFVKWLESRPSFRTTVEAEAAWEGWKANTAIAAMLAVEVTEPVAYGLFTDSGLIRMWSKKWFGECDGKSCQPVPLYTHPQPSQDAKDAATIERVARAIYAHVFTVTIPRMGVRTATFEEVWDIPAERERLTAQAQAAMAAMAKESGR